ncbi:MAG: hypothetical protein GY940_43275 [bacterium]|nr:hypothetical protein [bacterium]
MTVNQEEKFSPIERPISGREQWFAPSILGVVFLAVLFGLLWYGGSEMISRYGGGLWSWWIWALVLACLGLAASMVWGIAVLRKDIKARIIYEKALRKQGRQFRRLVDQLSQSNEDLDQFAYVASHDLQEPLHKVRAFSELLMKKYSASLDKDGCDYLERMHGASVRMQEMIENLLTLSRITTNAEPFKLVDLEKTLREVMSDLELVIKKHDAVISIGDLPVIEADPTQMHQLFANLVHNSLKYHREGVNPEINIRGKNAGKAGEEPGSPAGTGYSVIHVEDNGQGFEEEYVHRIFQPFERLHGRSRYGGLGIGLAICKKIVRRHGGTITALGTPGRGAKFILKLPERSPKQPVEETD